MKKKKKLFGAGGLDMERFSEITDKINEVTPYSINMGSLISSSSINSNGRINPFTSGLGQGISLGSTGASIGSAFGPVGTAIGGGVGLIAGLANGIISANKNNKRLASEDAKLAANSFARFRLSNDINRSLNDTSAGTNYNYYASGGDIKKIGNNIEKAVGATHEEGGIPYVKNGMEKAEIEDQEVIKDKRFVFSDRLLTTRGNTFAKEAEYISKTEEYKKAQEIREIANNILNNPKSTMIQKNTAKRNLEKNPDILDELFSEQEAVKQQAAMAQQQEVDNQTPAVQKIDYDENGLPKAAGGLDMGVYDRKAALRRNFENVTPYMDNIANQMIINKTPVVPSPELNRTPLTKTNLDINNQLSIINQANRNTIKAISGNSTNAQTTRANIIAANNAKMESIGQAFNSKYQAEDSMKNQQANAIANNEAYNNNLINAYKTNKAMRTNEMLSNQSANLSDMANDSLLLIGQENQRVLDKQKLAATLMQYAETGVLERSGIDKALQAIEGGASLDEAIKFANNHKEITIKTNKAKGKTGVNELLTKLTKNGFNPVNLGLLRQ